MTELWLLSSDQMSQIASFFPKPHGVAREDDRRVVSGIIYVLSMGCNGRPRQRGMVLTRRFTIGFGG